MPRRTARSTIRADSPVPTTRPCRLHVRSRRPTLLRSSRQAAARRRAAGRLHSALRHVEQLLIYTRVYSCVCVVVAPGARGGTPLTVVCGSVLHRASSVSLLGWNRSRLLFVPGGKACGRCDGRGSPCGLRYGILRLVRTACRRPAVWRRVPGERARLSRLPSKRTGEMSERRVRQ